MSLVVSACGGTGSGESAEGADEDASSDTTAGYEEFAGSVDDFYHVPDPLPEGEPGQLIRVQEVSAEGGYTTLRIMYHSRDAEDRDRAVTGILTYPTAEPAPEGGWPVVSMSPGTTGMGPQCAPSRAGQPAMSFGVRGVAVASDHIGRGPVGEVHSYLSKTGEGNAAIDAVRAARNLPEANAGTRWLSVGHSQGGHAALSAAELSAERAPELELLGTVAWAPGSDFDKVFDGIDPFVYRVLSTMIFYGQVAEHPYDIDPADYVTPELAAVADTVQTGCLDEITDAVLSWMGPLWINDPLQTEPARSLILANEVGTVRVDAPLLLIVGTADDRVHIERARTLHGRLCDIGQVTEYVEVEGADHGTVFDNTQQQAEAWLNARLDGAEPTSTCPA